MRNRDMNEAAEEVLKELETFYIDMKDNPKYNYNCSAYVETVRQIRLHPAFIYLMVVGDKILANEVSVEEELEND